MTRDVEMQDLPAIMADDEKAVEQSERNARNREEIHRCDGFTMISQKRKPSLCRLGIPRRAPHPTRDRCFGNIEPKHQQFPMDAWRAPGRIFNNHPEDE